jgi:uncharacterized protein
MLNQSGSTWRRWILFMPVLAVMFFAGISWVYAQRLTRARQCAVGEIPEDFPYPVENVAFTTGDDLLLKGWFVPGERGKGAVILLHGFTGNRLSMLPRARMLRRHGYGVLLYDARASGESAGDQISFGYRERHDLLAAVEFLKERGVQKIACLGVSQGGATILFAAENLRGMRCVICESVYDEMEHAVDRRMRHFTGIPGWLAGCAMVPFAEHRLGVAMDDVKPAAHIAALPCPVLIISGDQDNHTWPEDTQRPFAAAREPKELWMLAGAGHEDLLRFAGYEENVLSFVRRHFE